MQIYCIMRITKKQIISFKLISIIKIIFKKKDKLFKRNFLFELTMSRVYIYFVNANFQFFNFRNNEKFFIELDCCRRVNCIVKYKDEKYYTIKNENYFLIFFFFLQIILFCRS